MVLRTRRFFRRREEFTLLPDKVRVEWTRPLQSGITETPVRFLDPTWTAQRGSGPIRFLVMGAISLVLGLLVLWGGATVAKANGWGDAAALFVTGGFFTLVATPMSFWAWWNARYDVVVFTSLHPQHGPLVIPRSREQELETLQFADAVTERIRLLALTKPEG